MTNITITTPAESQHSDDPRQIKVAELVMSMGPRLDRFVSELINEQDATREAVNAACAVLNGTLAYQIAMYVVAASMTDKEGLALVKATVESLEVNYQNRVDVLRKDFAEFQKRKAH